MVYLIMLENKTIRQRSSHYENGRVKSYKEDNLHGEEDTDTEHEVTFCSSTPQHFIAHSIFPPNICRHIRQINLVSYISCRIITQSFCTLFGISVIDHFYLIATSPRSSSQHHEKKTILGT